MTPHRPAWDDLDQLDAQLEGYGRAARSVQARPRAPWIAYAAAGGGAWACASSAQAAIVYSGVQNRTAFVMEEADPGAFTTDVAPITFTGAGLRFEVGAGFANSTLELSSYFGTVALVPAAATAAPALNADSSLRRFGAGASVTNALFAVTNFPYAARVRGVATYPDAPSFTGGEWLLPNDPGFAAVRFEVAGNVHFGWIRLEWRDNFSVGGGAGPDDLPDTLVAIDWAWQDAPSTSIQTGDTGAVPEPGTALLSLLALGGAGVMAWKRRRKAV